jgi:hypothetical protein
MAVVGMLIIEFSASSTKHTARSFLDTRAELVLRSATEYAIMALQAHDYASTGNRINEINMTYSGFNVWIKFHYFCTDCNDNKGDCSSIKTEDTNMTTLIYVTVESKNKDFHIRKLRVTLQNL